MSVQCVDDAEVNSTEAESLLGRASSRRGSIERIQDSIDGGKAPRMHRWVFRAMMFGAVLLTLSGVLLAIMPWAVHRIVWNDVSITSTSSRLYLDWLDPAHDHIAIYRSFYFFNCTNPMEAMLSGVQPNYVRRGPYVYRESRKKIASSVRWYNDEGTVGYQYESYFAFDETLSRDDVTGDVLRESDDVVMVNMGLYGLTYRMSQLPPLIINGSSGFKDVYKWEACLGLSAMLQPQQIGPKSLFMNRSIGEILWGYSDPIWSLVHDFLPLVNYTAAYMFRSEWNGSYVVPSPYSFRSGQQCPLWDNLSHCNNTANMETREVSGADYGSDMGSITQWAGQSSLWWWGSEIPMYDGGEGIETHEEGPIVMPRADEPQPNQSAIDLMCRAVHGSDGFRFGPSVGQDSVLSYFADLFWRSVDMVFWKKSSVFGIDTLRFHVSNGTLESSEYNKHCFQQHRRGIFNFSRPLFGPAVAIKENFLDTDVTSNDLNFTLSHYICLDNKTTGDGVKNCTSRTMSEPMEVLAYLEKHHQRDSDPEAFREAFESYLDVHSLSGITLSAQARGTLFTPTFPLHVDGCDGIFPDEQQIARSLAPLATVNRFTTLSPALASHIRSVMSILHGVQITLYVLVGLSLLILVVGALIEIGRRFCPLSSSAGASNLDSQNSEQSFASSLKTVHTTTSPGGTQNNSKRRRKKLLTPIERDNFPVLNT